MKNLASFSERLDELIESRGITRGKVAEAVGITPRALQLYAKMERRPSLSTLMALADYFDTTIDYLVGRTDNPRDIKQ